ncbi:polyprenyl synthetase family protein [Litoribacillus peritrichatus]|uniref:Octaprenyl diphosphate synthase n=1 Tax=Litoribacillus peritrichatus TaxID=718191 RepID=A0ABP7NB15_9GAMM
MQKNNIYASVQSDFEAVNQFILGQLHSDVPLVVKIGHHIIESGGKRMRPLLALLSANALGYQGDKHIKLATVIEFLHTATLLHDDVVDSSDMRRGKTTANAKWGNEPSVLVGDFLYSRAFQILVETENLSVMRVLSNATCVIAEGEVLQLMNVKNPNVSEAQYMDVIYGKTAKLFEASTECGALLSTNNTNHIKASADYGLNLGLGFQIMDDILDYEGDATTMGKNVGDDLAEGKPTLPLIQAMKAGSETEAKLIRQAIRKGGLEDITQIQQIVHDSGALAYCKQKALELADKAQAALNMLPQNEHTKSMEAVLELAVDRKQ